MMYAIPATPPRPSPTVPSLRARPFEGLRRGAEPMLNFRWGVLAVVMLAACSSGRNDVINPESPDATTVKPSEQDPRTRAEQHREAYTPPTQPMARPDAGSARCGPDEMDCCGACIHKS